MMSNTHSSPLKGTTIWVTRAPHQAGELSSRLRKFGAHVVEVPAIDIIEPEDWSPLDAALDQIGKYDGIIFTSVNAVRFFFERQRSQHPAAPLRSLRVAAIGPATAGVLGQYGVSTHIVPERFQAEGLLDALGRLGSRIRGSRWLIPRAAEARSVLPDWLRRNGAQVDIVTTYRTIPAQETARRLPKLLERWPPDILTFTSSSTVRNFAQLAPPELLGQIVERARIAVIGAVTAATARELGFPVEICATRFTMAGLVEAIVNSKAHVH